MAKCKTFEQPTTTNYAKFRENKRLQNGCLQSATEAFAGSNATQSILKEKQMEVIERAATEGNSQKFEYSREFFFFYTIELEVLSYF